MRANWHQEKLVKMGKLLGVSHIIGGGIARIGKTYSINIKVLDVATGEIVYTDNEDCVCKIDQVFTQSTKNLAEKMAGFFSGGKFTAKGPSQSKKGGVFFAKPMVWVTGGVVAVTVVGGVLWMLADDKEEGVVVDREANIDIR